MATKNEFGVEQKVKPSKKVLQDDSIYAQFDADGDGVCDELEVAGCTDSSAFNYDSSATDDDGSCVAVVEGCMELDAYNYNPDANTYDGSCCFIAGCTDDTMFNYNSSACYDDGSCIPFIYGCTNPVSYTHLRAHETREERVWRHVL